MNAVQDRPQRYITRGYLLPANQGTAPLSLNNIIANIGCRQLLQACMKKKYQEASSMPVMAASASYKVMAG
jgi:hypothetical protein